MPTWSMVAIDYGYRRVAVPDKRIRECHPSRAAADNDIVCFNGCSHLRNTNGLAPHGPRD